MNFDLKQNNDEFKIFGMTIEKFSIIYGIFLISFGVVISLISGSNSFTSYIPSFFGLPILIFAFLSIKFVDKKKMFMHIVVIFGLIIFLGGLDFDDRLARLLIKEISAKYGIDPRKDDTALDHVPAHAANTSVPSS